eukprot:g3299.t1
MFHDFRDVVEASSLAAVNLPKAWYPTLSGLPDDVVESKKLSRLQLESITYASQRFLQRLTVQPLKGCKGDGGGDMGASLSNSSGLGGADFGPSGASFRPSGKPALSQRSIAPRRGFFIGDGTGVGKGRQCAAIILNNIARGRSKHLWFSVSRTLRLDAQRDFHDLGAEGVKVIDGCQELDRRSHKAFLSGADISGVLFSTYATMTSGGSKGSQRNRLDAIIEWCCRSRRAAPRGGKDGSGGRQRTSAEIEDESSFEGCIIFDECHKAKNFVPGKEMQGSKVARSVIEIQRRMPNARVVYCSATGVADILNMAFMSRLGLWGPQTPFKDYSEFSTDMTRRGVAALELLAMDMKACGSYISRNLGFQGCTFEIATVPLRRLDASLYESCALLWEDIRREIESAISITRPFAAAGSGQAAGGRKGKVWSAYWSTHQRFFKQLCLALKLSYVVTRAKNAIERGESVVIGLQTTGEAALNAAIATLGEEAAAKVSVLETVLVRFLRTHFPVQVIKPKKRPKPPPCPLVDIPVPPSHRIPGRVLFFRYRGAIQKLVVPVGVGPETTSVRVELSWTVLLADPNYQGGDVGVRRNENGWELVMTLSDEDEDEDAKGGEETGETTVDLTTEESSSTQDKPTLTKRRKKAKAGGGGAAAKTPKTSDVCVRKRNELTRRVRDLCLPHAALDSLIAQLGGKRRVAEMTGRRRRVVGGVVDVRDCGRGTDDVNIRERRAFMRGDKLVAIISDAASTGISLHADRGCANQRRRVHITLELPWSAEKAVQQLGRSHRSNASSAPRYELVVSDLAGETRFVSAVARRLQSLGALTQGDRRAASGLDLSEFNFMGKYGQKALRQIFECTVEGGRVVPDVDWIGVLRDARGGREGDDGGKIRGDHLEKEMKKTELEENDETSFAEFIQANFERMGLAEATVVMSVTGIRKRTYVVEASARSGGVKRFLSRLLGLKPSTQQILMGYFAATLKALEASARRDGTFDDGIVDMKGAARTTRTTKRRVLYQDPTSGTKTIAHTLKLDRGISFEEALERYTTFVGLGVGEIVHTRNFGLAKIVEWIDETRCMVRVLADADVTRHDAKEVAGDKAVLFSLPGAAAISMSVCDVAPRLRLESSAENGTTKEAEKGGDNGEREDDKKQEDDVENDDNTEQPTTTSASFSQFDAARHAFDAAREQDRAGFYTRSRGKKKTPWVLLALPRKASPSSSSRGTPTSSLRMTRKASSARRRASKIRTIRPNTGLSLRESTILWHYRKGATSPSPEKVDLEENEKDSGENEVLRSVSQTWKTIYRESALACVHGTSCTRGPNGSVCDVGARFRELTLICGSVTPLFDILRSVVDAGKREALQHRRAVAAFSASSRATTDVDEDDDLLVTASASTEEARGRASLPPLKVSPTELKRALQIVRVVVPRLGDADVGEVGETKKAGAGGGADNSDGTGDADTHGKEGDQQEHDHRQQQHHHCQQQKIVGVRFPTSLLDQLTEALRVSGMRLHTSSFRKVDIPWNVLTETSKGEKDGVVRSGGTDGVNSVSPPPSSSLGITFESYGTDAIVVRSVSRSLRETLVTSGHANIVGAIVDEIWTTVMGVSNGGKVGGKCGMTVRGATNVLRKVVENFDRQRRILSTMMSDGTYGGGTCATDVDSSPLSATMLESPTVTLRLLKPDDMENIDVGEVAGRRSAVEDPAPVDTRAKLRSFRGSQKKISAFFGIKAVSVATTQDRKTTTAFARNKTTNTDTSGKMWSCPRCTLDNPYYSLSCGACALLRRSRWSKSPECGVGDEDVEGGVSHKGVLSRKRRVASDGNAHGAIPRSTPTTKKKKTKRAIRGRQQTLMGLMAGKRADDPIDLSGG